MDISYGSTSLFSCLGSGFRALKVSVNDVSVCMCGVFVGLRAFMDGEALDVLRQFV